MTSRQRVGGTTIPAIVAAILAGNAGCAQLQKGWIDRLGPDRAAPAARTATVAPGGVPQADPYAARVALDDRPATPTWVPLPEGTAPPPPPGATPAPFQSSPAPPTAPPVAATPPPVESATTAPAPPAPADGLAPIEALVDVGLARLGAIRNYQVTLERQEQVRGSLLPAETVTLSVRSEPFAVRLEWPEGSNRGREVLYSEAECNGLMHVKMGKTLIPLPPIQLEPNSPLALSNSRHPITEAGLRDILTKIKAQIGQARAGDATIGQFALNGPLVPPEVGSPCHEILRDTPSGERWRLLLDQQSGLPALLEATAADGQILEHYRFRDIQADLATLDDPGAFDPAARFGRVASRAGNPDAAASTR